MIFESFMRLVDAGREGRNQGIAMGLPKLESIIDGVTRETNTLIFSNSGSGKKFIFSNLDFRNILYIRKNGLEILHYLYHNSNCFLDRKFEKYKEYCRLYKELYRILESKNGEGCDADPVITEEIKDSSVLYSVEGEPIIIEFKDPWINNNLI